MRSCTCMNFELIGQTDSTVYEMGWEYMYSCGPSMKVKEQSIIDDCVV